MSPLGWLLRIIFVSIFGSFVAVRGTKYLFGEATGLVPDLAQAGVGILTWTAIPTKAGKPGLGGGGGARTVSPKSYTPC